MTAATYPDLNGKVVLVTGATRGIGRQIARTLAEQKAHIVFNYREGKESQAKELQQELMICGASNASLVMFDLAKPEQVKSALEGFSKETPITGLVNNAGISKDQIVLRLKAEDMAETLNTNLLGPMLVTAALSRSFLKSENVSIVNIGSVVGLMGNPSQIS